MLAPITTDVIDGQEHTLAFAATCTLHPVVPVNEIAKSGGVSAASHSEFCGAGGTTLVPFAHRVMSTNWAHATGKQIDAKISRIYSVLLGIFVGQGISIITLCVVIS